MMKNKLHKGWFSQTLTAFLLALPLLASALEFDEIKDFGEVLKIPATAGDRGQIDVSWQIEKGYYLYNNKFLRFKTETAGVVLGEAKIPAGETEFDDLLGEEVIKFHDRLNIQIPLDSVAPGVDLISLKVRSQGCMDGVFCYPPTDQLLVVNLPPASQTAQLPDSPPAAATLAEALQTPAAGQGALAEDAALPPEQAFVYEAIAYSPDTILVRFTAQPGYYLYRDKLRFRVAGDGGVDISGVELPPGTTKDDPEFGPVEVYYGLIEIPVHVSRPAGPERNIGLVAD